MVRLLPAQLARDLTPRGTMMSATSNPQTIAEQGRKNYRDATTPDAAVPETLRTMVEKAVDRSL